MRRQKIKEKYLLQIKHTKDIRENTSKDFPSIIEKINGSILKLMIAFGCLLLLLIWGVVPVFVLTILGINYTTLSDFSRVMISLANDLVLIFIFLMIYRKSLVRDFKNYFHKDILGNIWCSFRYWLLGLGVMVISNAMIAVITNGQLAANEEAVRSLIDVFPLYMVFQLIIYAPITEELIFRKGIREGISNKWVFIFLSGLIFGGMHVIPSVKVAMDLIYLIPYCSFGFVFAYLYTKTDNIFSTIVAHAFHNGLALFLYLMAGIV